MTRLARTAILATTLLVLSGCGTIMNLEDRPTIACRRPPGTPGNRVYGGVQIDAERGWDMLSDGSDPAQGTYFLLIDLPISAVADTFTLPVTIRATATGKGPVKVAEPPPDALLKW